MKEILNPIINDGKSTVKCIRYYEVCLSYDLLNTQMAIFVYENKIYLCIMEYDFGKLKKTTLTDFGECEPDNMYKAVLTLKHNI